MSPDPADDLDPFNPHIIARASDAPRVGAAFTASDFTVSAASVACAPRSYDGLVAALVGDTPDAAPVAPDAWSYDPACVCERCVVHHVATCAPCGNAVARLLAARTDEELDAAFAASEDRLRKCPEPWRLAPGHEPPVAVVDAPLFTGSWDDITQEGVA